MPHAIGLYYTLTIELIWYAIVAVLFALGVLHHTERLAWAALAGLAAVGVRCRSLADRHVPFSTGFYIATMFIGTACARYTAGVLPARRLAALVAGAAVVAIAGGWANYERVPAPEATHAAFGLLPAVLPWAVVYAGFLLALRWRHLRFPAGAAVVRPRVVLGLPAAPGRAARGRRRRLRPVGRARSPARRHARGVGALAAVRRGARPGSRAALAGAHPGPLRSGRGRCRYGPRAVTGSRLTTLSRPSPGVSPSSPGRPRAWGGRPRTSSPTRGRRWR